MSYACPFDNLSLTCMFQYFQAATKGKNKFNSLTKMNFTASLLIQDMEEEPLIDSFQDIQRNYLQFINVINYFLVFMVQF